VVSEPGFIEPSMYLSEPSNLLSKKESTESECSN